MIRLINITVIIFCLTSSAALSILSPSPTGFGTHAQIIPIPCMFYYLLKIPCPSCGITTGLAYLFDGRWLEAMRAHPFGPIVLLALTITLGFSIFGAIKNRAWWNIIEKRLFQRLLLCGIGLYIGVWIVRLMVYYT